MRATRRHLNIAVLAFGMAMSAAGYRASGMAGNFQVRSESSQSFPSAEQPGSGSVEVTPAVQQLLDFKDSDVKFDLGNLMEILRDRRNEGWVLVAYPDPKTSKPLIGAGFSLDLPERNHPQRDPLNPRSFLEPSSAQLWQAAGLDPNRLQKILQRYNDDLAAWSKKRYRKKIRTLAPQITAEEAIRLLRIASIQAVYNAKAYCRNFDQLTASQQMALTQLVYQMGVNLETFDQFLTLINGDSTVEPQLQSSAGADVEHWKAVQQSLIQSQWARLYRARAISVIAMLDPQFLNNPGMAEMRISATLRPAVVHRRGSRSAASLRTASYRKHRGRSGHKKASGASARSASEASHRKVTAILARN